MNRATKDLVQLRLPATVLFTLEIALGAIVLGVMITLYNHIPNISHEVLIALASPALVFVFGGILWLYVIWKPVLCRIPVNARLMLQIPVQAVSIRAPLWVTGILLFILFTGAGFFWAF